MKQWTVAKLNKANASAIAENYDLPPIIATLLDIRGIVEENDIHDFLYNENVIDDPYVIKDMAKAVNRIKLSIDNGDLICVYGDYDADGVTSTALLYSYLETCGANVMFYIPSREREGYGLHTEAIDYLHNQGVSLIITVDNGIAAVDEIAYANSLSIDTVVTDHHLPGEVLPDAVAVVDMHQNDCKSKFKLLSGVGVAFKLILALEGEYADVDMLLENYSDLVALGTIGDIVPLLKENRVFVKRGLQNLSNTDRIGVSALIENSGLANKKLTAGNVSFTLVPRINAVGRLGSSAKSVSLLLTDDEITADQIASNLSDDNSERQKIEKDILDKINTIIANKPSIIQDRVIVIDGENWHQGVIGIVSSRVKECYGKPCIVLSSADDVCHGSGRSVEGFDLWEAVNYCNDILMQFGGHPMAVGLSLSDENIEKFRIKINEYAKSKVMPYHTLNIDCKINPQYINVDLAKQLSVLQPFGAGNPMPIFQLSNMKITNVVSLANDKHLRLHLTNRNTHITAMNFFCSINDFPYIIGDVVDLAVTLDVNEFKNTESLSVIVKDIKFAQVDNTDYLNSLRVYEMFCKGESLSKEQIRSISPTRDDFAVIYRYLKSNSYLGNLKIDVLAYRFNNTLSYGKIKVILEALNEQGLVAIYEDMNKLSVKILEVNEKVDLQNSTIIKHLREAYQNGQG